MRKKDLDIIAVLMADERISLRPFFQNMPHGVIITNASGKIIFYNQAQADLDGLKPEDVAGRPLAAVYPCGRWPTPDFSAAEGSSSAGVSLQYVTGQGRAVEASVSVWPLVMSDKPAGALYLVTAQPAAASALSPAEPQTGVRPSPEKRGFDRLIGQSEKFIKALNLGRSGAWSPSPVLLSGETGTGKEMFARGIHEHSPRADRPFVAINCAAIPQELLEGMLFGTARGAFTGAADKSGLFEEAHRGTLFLDELDSMPLKLQPKLLRALQERKIRRVGSPHELSLDVKIISAVGGRPEEVVKNGRLRSDLFYRLGVMVINLPPLRERQDDLPLLADYFIQKHNGILSRKVTGLSPEVLEAFQAYDWPGNVRELEHIIEAVLNVADDEKTITIDMLPDHFSLSPKITLGRYDAQDLGRFQDFFPQARIDEDGGFVSLKDKERAMIANALAITSGNVAKAARLLNISRQLLVYKMKKHGLERESFRG